MRNLIFAASLFVLACIIGAPRFIAVLSPQTYGYDEMRLVKAVRAEGRPDIAESMLSYTGSETDRGAQEPTPNDIYRTAAQYIIYADSAHQTFLISGTVDMEYVESLLAGLESFMIENPGFAGDRMMLASRTRLRLLCGNYAGIAADIGGQPDPCDLVIVSELYLRQQVGNSDFEDGWADETAEKYNSVYEKMSEIFTEGLSFDSAEERTEVLSAFRAIEKVALSPALGRIREQLLGYVEQADAIYSYSKLFFLQLYKIELTLGNAEKASEYMEFIADSVFYPLSPEPDDAQIAPDSGPGRTDDDGGPDATSGSGDEDDTEDYTESGNRDGAEDNELYNHALVFAGQVYTILFADRMEANSTEKGFIDNALEFIIMILPLIAAFVIALAVSIAILAVCGGYDKADSKRMYILESARTGSIVFGAIMVLGIVVFSWQFASVRGSSEGEAFFAIALESVDKGYEILSDAALFGRAPIFFAAAFGVFVLAIVVLNVVITVMKRKIEQPRSASNGAGRPSFMASSGITYTVPPELALKDNGNEKEADKGGEPDPDPGEVV